VRAGASALHRVASAVPDARGRCVVESARGTGETRVRAEEAAARAWWCYCGVVSRGARVMAVAPSLARATCSRHGRRVRVGWRRCTCGGGGCRVALHHWVRLCVVAVCRAETAGLVCVGCVVSRRVALVTWPVNLWWGGVGWGGVGGVCARGYGVYLVTSIDGVVWCCAAFNRRTPLDSLLKSHIPTTQLLPSALAHCPRLAIYRVASRRLCLICRSRRRDG
jgi:hypothetical protein